MDNNMVDAKNNNNDIPAKKGVVSKSSNNAWYIRKKDQITGPFPSGQISQLLVVGRLTIDDQVSHDKIIG